MSDETTTQASSLPSPVPPAGDVPPTGGAPADVVAAPEKPKGTRFADLGLNPRVLKAVEDMGFEYATPVQSATFPLARQGKDLMVQSRTGSGKTAAFGLPFVNDIVDPGVKGVQAIVLLPTRELALQVASELARLAAGSPLTVVPVYGGAPMGRQIELLRAGGQIVCGTPGRVLDHLRRGTLLLDQVRCAVLDECDEMLSMGFQEDIEAILEHTPESRQTLLFSATVPEGIQRLARRFLKQPEILKLSADNVGVQEIKHVYYAIPGISREQELLRVLKFENPKNAIIFCNTREETGRVAEFLRVQGFEAEAISSDLSQSDRERVMARMRTGTLPFLVATDVAARGIDIEKLSHVFNYTFPESPESYIHRTGRTGRAGRHGTAISLIGPTEVGSFYYLKLAYKLKPEERALPSESEIRSRREGESLTRLRGDLPAEPGAEWRGLARRLMVAADAERLVAGLLSKWLDPSKTEHAAARSRREHAGEIKKPASPSAHAHRPGAPGARAAESESGGAEGNGLAAETSQGDEGVLEASRSVPGQERSGLERSTTERPGLSRGPRADRPERGDRPERPERKDRLGDRGERSRFRDERSARPGDRDRDRRGPARPPTDRERPAERSPERPAERSLERPAVSAERSPERPAVSAERSPERPAERSPERLAERSSERLAERSPERPAERSSERERSPERPAERSPERPITMAPAPEKASGAGSGDREFWDVWKDDASSNPTTPSEPSRREESSPLAARESADDAPSADVVRLYVNLGRKDGAGENEIRDLLRAHADFEDVKSVEVMNTHTYLNVPSAQADSVVAALAGKTIGDRDIICERAKPRRSTR